MTTSLIIFKSILVFAGAQMPVSGIHLPCKGLPSFEWMEAHGCTCGWARCCQTQHSSLSLFWFNPVFMPTFLENYVSST